MGSCSFGEVEFSFGCGGGWSCAHDGARTVVPAHAGTHNRGACGYVRWCNGCDELQSAVVMGPGVRRDDAWRATVSQTVGAALAPVCPNRASKDSSPPAGPIRSLDEVEHRSRHAT